MTPEGELEEVVPCPECSALNPPAARFCADCGAMFRAARPRERARGREANADAVRKSRARQEFARVKNIVLTLRFVFWSSAILGALHVALWHTVLALLVDFLTGDWYLAFTFVVYAQFALMLAAALLVMRSPLVWAVVGACNWTLNTVLQWWFVAECATFNSAMTDYGRPEQQIELGMTVVFAGFWTLMLVAFWFAVAQAARVQRLLAENPELAIVRRRFDPAQRVAGGVAEHTRERRRQDGRRAWRVRLRLGGAIVAGLALVIAAIWFATRPPGVEGAVERFAALWRSGDAAGIDALSAHGGIREGLERRGWLAAPPRLGEPTIKSRGGTAVVTFPCDERELELGLRLVDDEWRLSAVVLPPYRLPPLEPALASFRAAWDAEGTAAVVEQFRPDLRERFGPLFEQICAKRGWTERRPKLGVVDPGRVQNGAVSVLFELGADELRLRFEYWHPSFRLTGLVPPKE